MRRFQPFAALNSPQSWELFYQALVVLFGGALVWFLISLFLSLLSGPGVILLTIALGAAVYYRSHKAQRRDLWIHQGRCGECGYDLRATPDRCPECGREAAQDEPVWRQIRRAYAHRQKAAEDQPPVPLSQPATTDAPSQQSAPANADL